MLSILEIGLQILKQVIPDPTARKDQEIKLLQLHQEGQLAEMSAELDKLRMQAEINKEEAKSTDPFVSRWRPFIGWVCGAALAWHYIGIAFFTWILKLAGVTEALPQVELGDLIVILIGMLGLGAYRTKEKLGKVA